MALVQTIISLARTFSMTTVAEGVETPEQFVALCDAGCTQSQGYLHSRPIPAADFVALLRNGRGELTRAAVASHSEAARGAALIERLMPGPAGAKPCPAWLAGFRE